MIRFSKFLALGCLLAAGCGGPAHEYDAIVTGTVTIDGELAQSGTVTFQPTSKEGKIAIGLINRDGSYSLRTGQGDLQQVDGGTVAPGEYVVTLSITAPPIQDERVKPGSPPIPGPSLISSKYATQATSDLKRTVKPGPQVIVLELERAEELDPEVDSSEEESAATGVDEVTDAVEAAGTPTVESNAGSDTSGDEKAEQ